MPKGQVVYVDETGIDQFLYREYARAPRGEAVYGLISGKKYKRVSIVAAQCDGKVFVPLEYDGTINSTLFEYWFEHVLLPALPRQAVIVMDNASFHHKNKQYPFAEKADMDLIFLPPYLWS